MSQYLSSTNAITGPAYANNGSGQISDHYHNQQLVKVPSYEFRVVEWTNEKDEIVKVGLQVKENMHNQYGSTDPEGIWKDVERIRMRQY